MHACTGRIKHCETAISGPNESVPRTIGITAESYDGPRRADVEGGSALTGARARTRSVKGGNSLPRQFGGYCQRDEDDCRPHKLKFPFRIIEWFHTP